MRVVRKGERGTYVPPGHDAKVFAEKLFDPSNGCTKVDVHITTFGAHCGMEEEVHESSDHILYLLDGVLTVKQGKAVVAHLSKGDAIHIPAGEPHQVENGTDRPATIVTITVPPT
ncbi:MAG: cupin domain-containing protein [Spirochaetes bacterium]|nr:cupin domain-containing protein [Spirochaetota bacterium]